MSVIYLNIGISIHGLKIEEIEQAENLIKKQMREATLTILSENNSLFNFRNWFESDIEVEISEFADD